MIKFGNTAHDGQKKTMMRSSSPSLLPFPGPLLEHEGVLPGLQLPGGVAHELPAQVRGVVSDDGGDGDDGEADGDSVGLFFWALEKNWSPQVRKKNPSL